MLDQRQSFGRGRGLTVALRPLTHILLHVDCVLGARAPLHHPLFHPLAESTGHRAVGHDPLRQLKPERYSLATDEFQSLQPGVALL